MGKFYAHVQVLRDGELMLQRHFDGDVVIGPSATAGVVLPGLDRDTLFLAAIEGGFAIRLPAAMHGKLRTGGHTLRVHDGLLHDPRPEPLVFNDGSRGVLWLGNGPLQLRFTVVRATPFPWRPRADRALLTALAATAIATVGAAVAVAHFGASPPRPASPTLRYRPALVERVLLARHKSRRPARARRGQSPLSAMAGGGGRTNATSTHAQRARDTRWTRRRVAKRVERLLTASFGLLAPQPAGLQRRTSTRRPRGPTRGSPSVLAALDGVAPDTELAPPPLSRRSARKLPDLAGSRAALPSRNAIRRAVARHRGEIRLCYERALLRRAKPPEGRLLLRWRIDSRGRAKTIRKLRDSIGDEGLARCLVARLEEWSFPPCGGAECDVIYPFEFFTQS